MKKLLTNIFAVTAISLSLGLTIGLSSSLKPSEVQEAKAETVEQYYSSITDNLNGVALRNALNTLNNSKRKKTMGYAGHKSYLKYTERTSTTPSNKMVGFYDNTLVSADWDDQVTWNREHVWPKSRGGDNVEADIHMVRPASVSINSERGNLFYGSSSGTYDPGQYVAEYRGVAARIIMYCAIADTNLSLVDKTNDSSANKSMGKLSDLLKWNLEYAPTKDTTSTALLVEQNRNEVIYSNSSLQGNRNPFIDHPEYACKIWGDTNDETRSICEGHYTPVTSTVSFDKDSVTLEVDEKTTLKATSSNGGTISWTLNNSNIALDKTSSTSGTEVTITGKAVGTTKITAANTDGATKDITVTVKEKTPVVPNIEISKTSISLKIGETATISADSNISDVSWWTDNENITLSKETSLSNEEITITAVKEGETILTASNDYLMTQTCKITITNPNPDPGPGSDSDSEPTEPDKEKETTINILFGCAGSITASSSIIFIASVLGLTFFIRRRKEK